MCRKSSTFLSISRFDRAFRYVSATILQKFSHTQLRRFSATLGNIDAGIIFLSLAQHFGKTTNQTYCRDLLMLKIISWGCGGESSRILCRFAKKY